MALVLDASTALAWLIDRTDPAEANRADEALRALYVQDGVVPALWYSEVTNGVLVAEKNGACTRAKSAQFLAMVATLPITLDPIAPSSTQASVLSLARSYKLTAYDCAYVELALRAGAPLATFDRRLAAAVRKAGGRVFGDRAQ